MKNKHIVFLFSIFLFFLQCKKSAESVDEGYAAPVFPETKEITVECLNDSFIFDIGSIGQLDTILSADKRPNETLNDGYVRIASLYVFPTCLIEIGRASCRERV